MRKKIFNWIKSISVLLLSIPFWFTLSCDIGLGEAVDVSAPTLTISYPPSGAIIKENFILSGTCADDVMITTVNVRVVNTTTGSEVYSGNADISGTSWSVNLNNKNDSAYAATNGWQFPDGTYEVTAWANDNSGKVSGVSSRTVDVDNTAPFFIIQNPGVTAVSTSGANAKIASPYGSTFSVTGTIADLHEVSKMQLEVYDEAGNLKGTFSESSIPTAGGTSVVFANSSTSGTIEYGNYATLYGTIENSTLTKKFKTVIKVTDCAKIYRNPGDSGTGTGNETSKVYLYDDVYSSYLSSSKGLGMSASTLMKISNGTASSSDSSRLSKSTLESKVKDTASLSDPDNRLAFSLNPAANPTYVVSGLDVFTNDKPNLSSNSIANNSAVTVSVSAGLNNTAVSPDTIHVWLKYLGSASDGQTLYDVSYARTNFLNNLESWSKKAREDYGENMGISSGAAYDADASGKFIEEIIKRTNGTGDVGDPDVWCVHDNTNKNSSSNTSLTVGFNMPSKVKKDGYYIIAVTGCDQDGLEFSQASIYGFKGIGTGKLPQIKVSSPGNLSLLATSAADDGTNNGLTFEGTAEIGDSKLKEIDVKVIVTDESGNDDLFRKEITGKANLKEEPAGSGKYTWKFSPSAAGNTGYDAAKCEPDGGDGKLYLYSAEFTVTDDENQTAEVTRTVHVDTVKPKVSITSLTPVVSDYDSHSNVNGEITVKGNVEETNLKNVRIKLFKAGEENDPAKTPVLDSGDLGKKFSYSVDFDTVSVANNNSDSDSKNIVIVVEAEDMVGNKNTTTSTIYNNKELGLNEPIVVNQLSDKPVIKPSNFEAVAEFTDINADNNLFGTSSNNKMKFSVADDDGTVTDIVAYIDGIKEADGSFKNFYSAGAVDLSGLEEGQHNVNIIAKDSGYSASPIANKMADKTYKIIVSEGAPAVSFEEDDKAYKKDSVVTVKGTLTNKSKSAVTVTFKDGASDKEITKADGSKSVTIDCPDKTVNGGKVDFTDSITVTSAEDKESVTVSYTVVDAYGQKESGKFRYNVDNKAPAINITSVTPVVKNSDSSKPDFVNGKISVAFTSSDNYLLDKVTYECYMSDMDSPMTVSGGTVSGGTKKAELCGAFDDSGATPADKEKKYGTTFEIDTTKISADETQKNLVVIMKAVDSAGNETVAYKTYIVDQTTDRPNVSPSNFEKLANGAKDVASGKNLFGITSNNNLLGGISDDDGVKNAWVYYKKATSYGADGSAVFGGASGNKQLVADGKSTSVSLSEALPKEEGKYEIWFVVQDTNYTSNTETKFNYVESDKYYVGVSSGAPTVTLTAPQNNGYTRSYEAASNNYLLVEGTTGNYSGTSTMIRSISRTAGSDVRDYEADGLLKALADTTDFAATDSTDAGKTKKTITDKIRPIVAASGTSVDITYTLTDHFGQSASATVTYVLDNDAAEFHDDTSGVTDNKFTVDQKAYDVNAWYSGENLNITGYFRDDHSGISTVKCKVLPDSKKDVASPSDDDFGDESDLAATLAKGTTNIYKFQGTIYGFELGEKNQLYIDVTDNVGNVSTTVIKDIKMDNLAPSPVGNFVTIDKDKSYFEAGGTVTVNGKQNVKIYGTASDTDSGLSKEVKFYDVKENLVVPVSETLKFSATDISAYKVTDIGFAENMASLAASAETYSAAKAQAYKSWTAIIPAASAKNGALKVVVKDNAGNEAKAQILNFQVDEKAPELKISTENSKINGIKSIAGTVTETYSLASLELYYSTSKTGTFAGGIREEDPKSPADFGWTKFGETITDASKIYSWNFENFDFNKLSGAADTKVKVTDENDPLYNKDIHSGEATIYILPVVKDAAGNCNAYSISLSGNTTTYTWDLAGNCKEYNVKMKEDRPVIQIANLAVRGDGSYILKYGDNAKINGSISDDDALNGSAVKVFKVSGKPIELKETADADGVTRIDESKIEGDTELNGTDWTFSPADPEDGLKKVYFYVEDNDGHIFYTGKDDSTLLNEVNRLYQPLVKVKNGSEMESTGVFEYTSDQYSPNITVNTIRTYRDADADTVPTTDSAIGTSVYAGGSLRKWIQFEFTGEDANGIDGMTLVAKDSSVPAKIKRLYAGAVPADAIKVNPGESSFVKEADENLVEDSTKTKSVWTTDKFDVSSFATGEVSLTVNVYDKSGLKGNGSYTFNVDNKGPKVSNITPRSNEQKTGNFVVKGNASDSDTGRSGLAETVAVTYLVPTITQQGKTDDWLAENAAWTDKSPFYTEWEFSFNGGDGTNDCESFETYSVNGADDDHTYGTEDAQSVWTIPVYIKAVDKLGNYTIEKHNILFNPEGDRPETKITYPTDANYAKDTDEKSLGYVTLGSTIRITGNVNILNMDAEGVYPDGVYLQIAAEVLKAKKALTMYRAKKELTISGKTVKEGSFLKSTAGLTLSTDYEIVNVGANALISTAQAAVLTEGTDYYHDEDWGNAAKAKAGSGSGNYGYSVVTAGTISAVNPSKQNIATFDSGHSGFKDNASRSAWWGIPATNTSSSWSLAVNQRNELNPAVGSGTTNNIAIRACAVNNVGKVGAWSDVYYIHIDDAAPVVKKAVMRQYETVRHSTATADALSNDLKVTAEKPYDQGMYLKGEWYLYLEVEDETGIAWDGAVSNPKISLATQNCSSTVYTKHYKSSENTDAYKVWVPIKGDEGNLLQYKISATDADAGNPHTVTSTYQFYIDNTAPVIGTVTSTASGTKNSFESEANKLSAYKIQDSDGTYSIKNSVTESGSGFERAVYYFMRRKYTGSEKAYEITGNAGLLDPYSIGSDGKPTKDKIALDDLETVKLTQKIGGTDYEFTLYGKKVSGTSTKTTFTAANSADITDNTHIRNGGLVQVDGVLRRIESISGSTVTFDTEATGKATSAVFIYAQVVDNTSSENSKIKDDTDPYKYVFEDDDDDGDGMPEKVDTKAGGASWTAEFRSTNMNDGPVTLVMLVFDKAGNVNSKTIDTYVSNNAPRIAKVYLGTNINKSKNGSGQDTFTEEEFVEYNWQNDDWKKSGGLTLNTSEYKKGVYKGSGKGKAFTIKQGLAVVPEIIGGNKSIKMMFKKSASNAEAMKKGDGTLKSPVTSGVQTDFMKSYDEDYDAETNGSRFKAFTVSNSEFAGLTEDGTNGMSFTFWDETEDAVQGENSQNVVLYVSDFHLDIVDNFKPKVNVFRFKWNSKDDNSLYQNKTANGHIELESDLVKADGTDTVLKTTYGDDPKVSGKIVIRGTAYDDVCLNVLHVDFAGIVSADVASYDSSTESWTVSTANLSDDGYVFRVLSHKNGEIASTDRNFSAGESAYFGQDGHKVAWELTVDTEKVKVGNAVVYAALNQKLVVSAKDASANDSVETASAAADETGLEGVDLDRVKNKGSYTMDIVPYITKVTTSMSSLSRKTPSMYSRTAFGHYPVRIVRKDANGGSGSSETATYTGFNLGSNSSVDAKDLETADDAMTGGRSSKFHVTVNGVSSINNMNNNNAKGSFDSDINDRSSYSDKNTYAYNRQPNNVNNNLLTDDVVFDVWEINSAAAVPISGKIEQPVMKIRPTDGKVGFAFVNGPLYFSMGGSSASQDYSYQYWAASFDFFTSVGFTYDDAGNSYGVAAGGDINANEADKFAMYTSEKGLGFVNDRRYTSYDTKKAYRMESIAQRNSNGVIDFDKQRIKSPSLAATDHGTSGKNIYLAYYDAMNDEIRFKAGNTKSSNTVYMQSKQYGGENDSWYVIDGSASGHFNPKTRDLKVGNFIKLYDGDGIAINDNEYEIIEIGTANGDTDHTMKLALNGVPVSPFPTGPVAKTPGYRITVRETYTGNGSFIDTETQRAPYYYRNGTVSLLAGGDTGNGAGEYVALAVAKGASYDGDVVHAVWYDTANRTLRYAYNDTPLTDRNGTKDFSGWKGYSAVFGSSTEYDEAGEYCKIATDANGGVHIAAYDPVNLDLVYAYKERGSSTFKTCVVDANGVVGSNLTLDVALVGGKPVPYIGYYATSCIKPKYARFVGDYSAESIDGSVNDEVTGLWEISVVPTAEVIEMQSNQHNDINIGVWKSAGTLTASAKGNSETSNSPNGYSSTSYGQCYGNGTKNAVLGYAIKHGSSGDNIETAQMK